MLKLIKYEFRKTRMTKAIILAITLIAQVVFLIGLYTDNDASTSVGILGLTMLAFGGILIIGLQSIRTLHQDMNTRQSYMLFMTPNSSYKILGSKLFECGLSILIAGVFFFALGTLDITLLLARLGELNELWKFIKEFLSDLTIDGRTVDLNAGAFASAGFSVLTSWFFSVTTACLAVVISAALLNGRRFNGLISFIFFLLLSWGCSWISGLITKPINDTTVLMIVGGLISLAFSVIMYIVTAKIMEDKLSV